MCVYRIVVKWSASVSAYWYWYMYVYSSDSDQSRDTTVARRPTATTTTTTTTTPVVLYDGCTRHVVIVIIISQVQLQHHSQHVFITVTWRGHAHTTPVNQPADRRHCRSAWLSDENRRAIIRRRPTTLDMMIDSLLRLLDLVSEKLITVLRLIICCWIRSELPTTCVATRVLCYLFCFVLLCSVSNDINSSLCASWPAVLHSP